MSSEVLRLDHQLCFALYATTRAVMQAYHPLLEELGLTYPQYLVLLALWEEDGLSVGALGERLFLDSGTLTPLLKRVERAGLVVRERSKEDERIVTIRLTTEGRRLEKRAQKIPLAMLCRMGLAEAEIRRLRQDVMRLFERVRPRDSDSTPVSLNPKSKEKRK